MKDILKYIGIGASAFALVLSMMVGVSPNALADSKDGIDNIWRGDYTASAGLHIKRYASTSAPSDGIAYPGHLWQADCIAGNGTPVNGNYAWFRARDKATNIKGYSSAAYMRISYSPKITYVSNGNTCIYLPTGK
jgi:hypothetical protein